MMLINYVRTECYSFHSYGIDVNIIDLQNFIMTFKKQIFDFNNRINLAFGRS